MKDDYKAPKRETKKLTFIEPPHFFTYGAGKEAVRLMVRDGATEKIFKAVSFNEGVVEKIKKDSNLREGAEVECYGNFKEDKFGVQSFIINQIFKDGDTRTFKERTIEEKGGLNRYKKWLDEDAEYYKRRGLVKIYLLLDDGTYSARWQKKEDSCLFQDKWEDILEHCSNVLGAKVVTDKVRAWCKDVGFSEKELATFPPRLIPAWKEFKHKLLEEANNAPSGILDSMDTEEYPEEEVRKMMGIA